MAERLGNLGYGAMKKQTDDNTPIVPTVFFPLYKADITTDTALDEDNPIAGVRSKVFNSYMGLRKHTGSIDVLAEPNTAKYFFDMMLAIGNVSGSGPYTWPFTEGLSNAYTLDILKGQVVERFWGVMVEDIEPSFDKNKMKFGLSVSARGSFLSRKIATISTVTITLDTSYDPAPNKGLVAGDLVRVLKADGTAIDTTVATSGVNADGITVTLDNSVAAAAIGDKIFIRAQTPSYTLKTPFQWARTEFRFSDTAANALTATHSPKEEGSKWKISHKFEDSEGAHRSGSYDPNKLVRLQPEAEITLKAFFDDANDLQQFLDVSNTALVVRHFSESGYELRLTFDSLKLKVNKRPIESAKIIYAEITGTPNYNSVNGEAFSVKVLNNLSS